MSLQNKHIISLEDISIGYAGSANLISGVNVSVKEGEMVALIGKNGSGKSTLLRTIAALKKPVNGSVFIEKRINSTIPAHEFAKILSFVETGTTIVENLTVYELVSIGRHPYTNWWGRIKESDNKKILEAIGFVGMNDFSNVPVNRLSDGERQRVMIARALAQETKLLLLDEPTAFLDLPNKFEIISVLHRLKKSGKSVIFSTHDLETAFLFADKCWVIHENNIIHGGVEDLGIDNVYSDIFKDSNIQFNEAEMKFIPKRVSEGDIYLEGNNASVLNWTRRALERVGFNINSKISNAYPEIQLISSGDNKWRVSFEGNTSEFTTLYDMTLYLTQLN